MQSKRAEALPFRLAESPHFGTKYSGLYFHPKGAPTNVREMLGYSKYFAYLCQYPNSGTLRYAERAAKTKRLE